MRVFTIGHGTRPVDELLLCLTAAGVETLVDVRRFPGSRRNPQFARDALAASLAAAGIEYRHAVELGGRRSGEPGAERFPCVDTPGFASYAARMATAEWQAALARELAQPVPCLLCAETLWWRCNRRLIADLMTARGVEVLHLLRPNELQRHRLLPGAEAREGMLYLCGQPVA
jgi:uncharacterized protein (DUF488 family)